MPSTPNLFKYRPTFPTAPLKYSRKIVWCGVVWCGVGTCWRVMLMGWDTVVAGG